MKSTTYFAEITNWKAEKYLSEWKTRIHLLARLLTLCQLRNFPSEFTENYFAVFDQSRCSIYLTWHRSLLFFPKFTFIIPFMVWFQDSSQIKGRKYIFILGSSVTIGRSNFFILLKAKCPIFHFLHQSRTILNLI